MSSAILVNVRPRILIDGQHLAAFDERIISVDVGQSTQDSARCSLRYWVDYTRPAGFGLDTSQFGGELSVEMPTRAGAELVFRGGVAGLQMDYPPDQPPHASLLLEDRLRALRTVRRTQVFNQATDLDVLQVVTGEHGLSISMQAAPAGPVRDVIVQANQTDFEFILERAHRVGAEVWIEDNALVVRRREDWSTASPLVLEYGARLRGFTVQADLTEQRTGLHVTGWDPAQKLALDALAEPPSGAAMLNHGLGGGALVQQLMGSRPQRVVHANPLTNAEAELLARTRLERDAWRFVTGRGVAEGTPEIRVGRVLELNGLGELFDGKYYCVRVRHVFDLGEGYRTVFEVERPDVGSRAKPSVMSQSLRRTEPAVATSAARKRRPA